MPSAILTGATGILGRSTLHELISSDSPNWSTIHALSHRQPPPLPSLAEDSGAAPAKRPKIHHSKIDLLSPPETIAMQLQARDVKAEYLFFSAYLQRGDEGEMERVNGTAPPTVPSLLFS